MEAATEIRSKTRVPRLSRQVEILSAGRKASLKPQEHDKHCTTTTWACDPLCKKQCVQSAAAASAIPAVCRQQRSPARPITSKVRRRSHATQPKLCRMHASSDLSEYAAECSQSVGNRCDNEGGAADSPGSAERPWEGSLPDSEASDGDSDESDAIIIPEDFCFDGNRWVSTVDGGCGEIRFEESDDGSGIWEKKYYIEGRAVTQKEFDRDGRTVPRQDCD